MNIQVLLYNLVNRVEELAELHRSVAAVNLTDDSAGFRVECRKGLFRLFSAKQEFSSEWHRFLHPKDTDDKQTLQLKLTRERFPFQFLDKTIEISQVELFLKLENGKTYTEIYAGGTPLTVSLTPPEGTDVSEPLESIASFLNGIPHAVVDVSSDAKVFGTWALTAQETDIAQLAAELRQPVTVDGVTHQHLKPDAIEDLIIVCHYSVT